MSRTALVTGASSGIGAACAGLLASRGYRVLGTSRNPDTAAKVPGVEYLRLDLEDRASVDALAEAAGPVDVLVNNAGESQVGPLEEVPIDEVRRLFELNVFAPVRLTQLLTPGMRKRGYGRVVMVGSMQASFPLAFRSSYGASKAAIKAFASNARFELSPHGVWLSTVEPGSINTGISTRRDKHLADGSPFAADYRTVLGRLDANEPKGVSAEKVAEVVLRAIEADRPRPLYAVGSNAPVVFTAQRLLPASVVERGVARIHGLKR